MTLLALYGLLAIAYLCIALAVFLLAIHAWQATSRDLRR